MQKCPRCKTRKVKTMTELDRSGNADRVLTVCINCQSVLKVKKIRKRWPWA